MIRGSRTFSRIFFLLYAFLFVESQISTQYLCKPDQTTQCFEKVPIESYKILIGHNVIFPCKIKNLISLVQWRLKDTMMGFNPVGDRVGRFYLLGDKQSGDYQLQLRNVSKTDEGSYECQVSPKRGQPLMRWSTRLFVLIKPEKPYFINLYENTLFHVSPTIKRASITCVSKGGDPPPVITWYINDKEVKQNDSMTIQNIRNQSQLSISHKIITNGDRITCAVTNEAMKLDEYQQNHQYRVSVTVQIVKEPGLPVIEGFNVNTKYRAGDQLNMSCWATAGLPEGSLIWKRIRRNGVEESLSFKYKKDKDRLVNVISTFLSAQDHNAEFTCIAQNRMTNFSVKQSKIQVKVEYPPDSLTIMTNNSATGVDIIVEGNVGTSDILICKTSLFYGNTKITWLNESTSLASNLFSTETLNEGKNGIYIVSKLMVKFDKSDNNRIYKCMAQSVNDAELFARVRLRIKSPPSQPTIKMLPDENSVLVDLEAAIHCQTSDGNPLPKLFWYKNNKLVQENIQQESQGNVVTSTLKIFPKISDHGAIFTCAANNSALPKGVTSRSVNLNVLFPPQNIKLVVQSTLPATSNTNVMLRCTADTSNPPATLAWEITPCDLRRSSIEISFNKMQACRQRDNFNSHTVKEFNNTSINVYNASISYLQVRVTEDTDLSTVVCRATNEPFKERHILMDEQILRVAYAPRLLGSVNLEPMQQGSSRNHTLNILANPPLTALKLFRKGSSIPVDHARLRFDLELLHLKITQIKAEDMGKYIFEATNTVGISRIPLFFNVTYPVKITHAVMMTKPPVRPEDQVELKCQANGNPAPHQLQWTFNNKRIGCHQITKDSNGHTKLNTSCQKYGSHEDQIILILTINRVKISDSGLYVCEANNGVGSLAKSEPIKMMLDVQPYSVLSIANRRVAAQINKPATLVCRVRAWPKPLFKWFVVNKELKKSNKYTISDVREASTEALGTFEQQITIDQLDSNDYKTYECQAHNKYGIESIKINVTGTSRPDEPRALRAANITATTVDVSWLAGHNGGFLQTFNVKFEVVGLTIARYEDVVQPADGSTFVRTRLEHLRPGHSYNIRVNARNAEHGASEYTQPVTISTLPVISNRTPQTHQNTPILVIVGSCIAGFFILLINISCLACFLRRRKHGHGCGECFCNNNNHDSLRTYSDEINKNLDNVELYPSSRINDYNRQLKNNFNTYDHNNFRYHPPLSSKCSLYGDYNDSNESSASFLSSHEHETCLKSTLNCRNKLQPTEFLHSQCTLSRVGPDVALSCSPKKYQRNGSDNVWQSATNCLISSNACCTENSSGNGLPLRHPYVQSKAFSHLDHRFILSNHSACCNTPENVSNSNPSYQISSPDAMIEITEPLIFDQEQYATELRRIQSQNAHHHQQNSFLTTKSKNLDFASHCTSNILLSNQKKTDSIATTAIQQNDGLTSIKLGTFHFPDSHLV